MSPPENTSITPSVRKRKSNNRPTIWPVAGNDCFFSNQNPSSAAAKTTPVIIAEQTMIVKSRALADRHCTSSPCIMSRARNQRKRLACLANGLSIPSLAFRGQFQKDVFQRTGELGLPAERFQASATDQSA